MLEEDPTNGPEVTIGSSLEPIPGDQRIIIANTGHEEVSGTGERFAGQEGWGGRFLATTVPGDVFIHHKTPQQFYTEELRLALDLNTRFDGQLVSPDSTFEFKSRGNSLKLPQEDLNIIKGLVSDASELVAFCLNGSVSQLASRIGVKMPMTPKQRNFFQDKVTGTDWLVSKYNVAFPKGFTVTTISEALAALRELEGEAVFKVAQSAAGLGTSERVSAGVNLDQKQVKALLSDPKWSANLPKGLRVERWIPDVVASFGQAYHLADNEIRIADPTKMIMEGPKYRASITLDQMDYLGTLLGAQTIAVTKALHEEGARGNGAVDYILTESGAIYVTENNQRISGQSPLLAVLARLGYEKGVIYTSKLTSCTYKQLVEVSRSGNEAAGLETLPIAIIPHPQTSQRQYHYLVMGNQTNQEAIMETVEYVESRI